MPTSPGPGRPGGDNGFSMISRPPWIPEIQPFQRAQGWQISSAPDRLTMRGQAWAAVAKCPGFPVWIARACPAYLGNA